jgi:hypothetical protein
MGSFFDQALNGTWRNAGRLAFDHPDAVGWQAGQCMLDKFELSFSLRDQLFAMNQIRNLIMLAMLRTRLWALRLAIND